jgi:hypothetical protein
VNTNLYTKYDACFVDALSGIVKKADSVSDNRTSVRVYFKTAQSSGADPSMQVLLLLYNESGYQEAYASETENFLKTLGKKQRGRGGKKVGTPSKKLELLWEQHQEQHQEQQWEQRAQEQQQ